MRSPRLYGIRTPPPKAIRCFAPLLPLPTLRKIPAGSILAATTSIRASRLRVKNSVTSPLHFVAGKSAETNLPSTRCRASSLHSTVSADHARCYRLLNDLPMGHPIAQALRAKLMLNLPSSAFRPSSLHSTVSADHARCYRLLNDLPMGHPIAQALWAKLMLNLPSSAFRPSSLHSTVSADHARCYRLVRKLIH